jgi:hypothetical protein
MHLELTGVSSSIKVVFKSAVKKAPKIIIIILSKQRIMKFLQFSEKHNFFGFVEPNEM